MKNALLDDIEKAIQETKKEILNKEEQLEELLGQVEEQEN